MLPRSQRLGGFRGLSVLTLLAAASIAQAQGAARAAERADPLDPQARVPALTPPSSLAGYRRPGDDKPVPWKEANEAVQRLGGWRAYARETQQPEAAASAPVRRDAPAPAPVTAPAQGAHKTH